MTVRPLPEPDDGARLEPIAGMNAVTIRRDPVKVVPEGSYVAMVFRVTGYDPDCDGSLMARLQPVNRFGEAIGNERDCQGLYPDTEVVLDEPGDLHDMAELSP